MTAKVQINQKNDSPAFQDLSEEQRETRHRWTESEIWLVKWEPAWEAAKTIRSSPNYLKMAEEYETSTMSTSDTRNDKYVDNLARQGLEDPNRLTPKWEPKLRIQLGIKFILTRNQLAHKTISRAQETVSCRTDRLILSEHLQYKRQHMTVSNATHLANCHKQRTG